MGGREGGAARALVLAVLRVLVAERLATARATDHLYGALAAALAPREALIRCHLDRAGARAAAEGAAGGCSAGGCWARSSPSC